MLWLGMCGLLRTKTALHFSHSKSHANPSRYATPARNPPRNRKHSVGLPNVLAAQTAIPPMGSAQSDPRPQSQLTTSLRKSAGMTVWMKDKDEDDDDDE
jgi:hypothetical protein